MRLGSLCFAISFALILAGCGGGGGGSTALPVAAPGAPASTGQVVKAKATLVIPNAAHSQLRAGKFVSPSTNGVSVVTYAHTDTKHATPLATVVTDVSGTSPACTTTSNGRTCTVGLGGPVGSDDFVFNLYDTAPSSGTIPTSAKLLGTAGVTQ